MKITVSKYRGVHLWRVERVIVLFCYSIGNSSIYILVFNIFVTFTILILSFLFYHCNIRLSCHNFTILAFSISISNFYDSYFINFIFLFYFYHFNIYYPYLSLYFITLILHSTILIFAIFYFKSLRILLYQFCIFILI